MDSSYSLYSDFDGDTQIALKHSNTHKVPQDFYFTFHKLLFRDSVEDIFFLSSVRVLKKDW